VKYVTFNGKPLADRRIHHNDLARGGTLEFEMDRRKMQFPVDWRGRAQVRPSMRSARGD